MSPEAWRSRRSSSCCGRRPYRPAAQLCPGAERGSGGPGSQRGFRQSGLLNWSGYFLAFLACRFSFSVSRLLFHALLRVLVLGRHVLTSVWVRVRLSAVAQDVHPLAAQVSLHVRRGSAARIVATPSSSTSTT